MATLVVASCRNSDSGGGGNGRSGTGDGGSEPSQIQQTLQYNSNTTP